MTARIHPRTYDPRKTQANRSSLKSLFVKDKDQVTKCGDDYARVRSKGLRCITQNLGLLLFKSLITCFFKELAVALFSHPAGTFQMAIMDSASAISVNFGVEAKNDRRSLAPIGTFFVSVKQP